jgi:CheY-like chemotaxis protein
MSRKILIIEDEREMARLMSWGLAQSDFKTRLAFNGQEGLDALKEEEPDLILTDIVMPGMDGYALCRRLQQNGILSRIPVIVLTAFANKAEEFKDFGIQEFLVKPFGGQQLVEVIERVLERSRHSQTKTIVLQDENNEALAALHQFRAMGHKAKIEAVHNDSEFIENVLRLQPAVLILDGSRKDVSTEQLIRSLHSYVILKDMVILFYFKNKDEELSKPKGWFKRKDKEKEALEETKKVYLQAGASRCLESLDRETILSLLLQYCRT